MSDTAPKESLEEKPDPTDRELVGRVQGGDAAAFDLLIEKYKGRMYGVLYNMLGNHDDAMDLLQDAFVKAFQSIQKFRTNSNFYTWLYRIGVNTALNFIRKRKDGHLSLNEFTSDADDEPFLKEMASKENVDGELKLDELRKNLNEALQKLSKEHRTVVVLHDIEGLKHQEIAEVLGCGEATVRTRLYYAHQQLQGMLANYL